MNSAKRVGVVRVWGLEEGIQKELSLEELPSPHPRQTGQGAGDGLSKQKQLGVGGALRGRLCVRGLPRFGGCGPRWAFHTKQRDRL